MRASRQGQAGKGKPARASRQGQAGKGKLYFGDNLGILRDKIKDESIDLIYLDPPFNSKADYNILFKTPDKIESKAQIRAFNDTWHWTHESELAYDELLKTNVRIAEVVKGLRNAIGENDMMAYLVMMGVRLIELHRVLKDTGALYLHCDPTASHYLKVLLDSIFGPTNFRNEIIWKRTTGQKIKHQSGSKLRFNKSSDTILFYAKPEHRPNPIYIWTDKFINRSTMIDENGREFTTSPITLSPSMGRRPNQEYTYKGYTPKYGWRCIRSTLEKWDREGRIHWNSKGTPRRKIFLDESKGLEVGSIWDDINPLTSTSAERMGYPTQKPVKLLERIMQASAKEGDIILDPFCGCGTTIAASHNLEYTWVGIDITHLAIALIEKRMKKSFGIGINVEGVPESFASAKDLARRDKFQFQAWAVSLIPNALPNDIKTRDEGVDGIGTINLGKDAKGKNKEITVIISVKGGDNISPEMVRELKGTKSSEPDKQDDKLRILIILDEPTDAMKTDAARAGTISTPLGQRYPRLQIYTIKNYFDGIPPKLPTMTDYITSKRVKLTRRKDWQDRI